MTYSSNNSTPPHHLTLLPTDMTWFYDPWTGMIAVQAAHLILQMVPVTLWKRYELPAICYHHPTPRLLVTWPHIPLPDQPSLAWGGQDGLTPSAAVPVCGMETGRHGLPHCLR